MKSLPGWLRVLLLVGVLVTAVFFLAIEFPTDPEVEEPPELTVRVLLVGEDEARERISVGGITQPLRRSMPAPRIGARVMEMAVEEGESVSAGQLLVRLDDRDVSAGAAAARQQVERAEQALVEAERNLQRMSRLLQEELVARVRLEEAELRQADTRAALRNAEARLREAETALEDVRVEAPFAGVVTSLLVEAGDLAAPGRPVAVVEDRSRLRVLAGVGQAGVELPPGTLATVELPGRRGTVEGRVDAVLPGEAGAPGSRMWIEIPTVPGLSPGVSVRVRIPVPDAAVQRWAVVPEEALIRRGQLEGVFLVPEEALEEELPVRTRVLLRWIVTAPGEEPGQRRVLSGIGPGAVVVVGPQVRELWSGRPVTVEEVMRPGGGFPP